MKCRKILSFLVCAALMTQTTLAAALPGEPQGGRPMGMASGTEEICVEAPALSEEESYPCTLPEAQSKNDVKQASQEPYAETENTKEPVWEKEQEETPMNEDEPFAPAGEESVSDGLPPVADETDEESSGEDTASSCIEVGSDNKSDEPELGDQDSSAEAEAADGSLAEPDVAENKEQPEESAVGSKEDSDAVYEPVFKTVDFALENRVEADDTGSVVFHNQELIDFVFPAAIHEDAVLKIGAEAFKGCEIFRTVMIPACVTEIGENAFAQCPNLERIVLLDRYHADDMVLGENWAGDATVEFGLIVLEEENTVSGDGEVEMKPEKEQQTESNTESAPVTPPNEEPAADPAQTEADTGTEEVLDEGPSKDGSTETFSPEEEDSTAPDEEETTFKEDTEDAANVTPAPTEPSDTDSETEVLQEPSEDPRDQGMDPTQGTDSSSPKNILPPTEPVDATPPPEETEFEGEQEEGIPDEKETGDSPDRGMNDLLLPDNTEPIAEF